MLPDLFSVDSSPVAEPPQFVRIQELAQSLARIQFGPRWRSGRQSSARRPPLRHDERVVALPDVCRGSEVFLHRGWGESRTSPFGLEQVGHVENLERTKMEKGRENKNPE